ncbi:hypothetical protein N9917_01135 [Deltaproteobacteria bacterium]|nr:hypothetical protein [Deltaproteobacteria bacterium]
MGSLLRVVDFGSINRQKNVVTLIMEFQINPDCAPFLVSSTKSLVWVSKFRNDVVRAAVRRGVPSIGHYFMEVVFSIAAMGEETEWGNVHPLTRKGIEASVEHLKYFDIEEVELLVSESGYEKDIAKAWRGKDEDGEPLILGTPFSMCAWLEPGYVVAVPSDRDFLGFLGWGNERMISLVHNAARGMAVARRAPKK